MPTSLNPGDVVAIHGRRNGRAHWVKLSILAECALGRVAHLVGRDGLWHVEPTGIGPLWIMERQTCSRAPVIRRDEIAAALGSLQRSAVEAWWLEGLR